MFNVNLVNIDGEGFLTAFINYIPGNDKRKLKKLMRLFIHALVVAAQNPEWSWDRVLISASAEMGISKSIVHYKATILGEIWTYLFLCQLEEIFPKMTRKLLQSESRYYFAVNDLPRKRFSNNYPLTLKQDGVYADLGVQNGG